MNLPVVDSTGACSLWVRESFALESVREGINLAEIEPGFLLDWARVIGVVYPGSCYWVFWSSDSGCGKDILERKGFS